MRNRQIVIGDVHGHYDALMTLLDEVAPSQDDEIYFLGDLIDRGPKSAEVVNFVMENNYPCLLGNHEQMLLDVFANGQPSARRFQSWISTVGRKTVESYGQGIPQAHIHWMKSLPTHLDLGKFWLVHAGVHPRMPLETQTAEQFCWIREEFHAMNQPFFPNKTIITGHTITFTIPGVFPGKIARGEGWLGIDTGVYHPQSGWLTALDTTHEQVYQVNTKQGRIRTMPLEEAVTSVNPNHIRANGLMARSL